MKKLDGFAIVTGSSRGIGAAMVQQLAKEGYDVVINHVSSRSAEKAQALAEEIKNQYGVGAVVVQANVEEYEGCKAIVNAGIEAFGEKIAILINNAGIDNGRMFWETPIEDIERMVRVELLGSMYCTHIVLPYMIKEKAGRIIFQSSVCGVMGVATQADYSAAKAGLIGLTKALAKEVGPYHITVNSIAPGMIETDMIAAANEENKEALRAMTPLGVLGKVEDISECMSYIVNAPFLTGQVISPNGGLTI